MLYRFICITMPVWLNAKVKLVVHSPNWDARSHAMVCTLPFTTGAATRLSDYFNSRLRYHVYIYMYICIQKAKEREREKEKGRNNRICTRTQYTLQLQLRAYKMQIRNTPRAWIELTQSVFFLFFHVNKWYIFSAYSTYSFTVHFSLNLNNYKWTFSTFKNGTNVSLSCTLFYFSLFFHLRSRFLFLSFTLVLFLTFFRAIFLSLTYFCLCFFFHVCLTNAYIFGCVSSLR